MRVSLLFLLLGILIFSVVPVTAQEWSAGQKEVWQDVNDYWALFAKGDLEGFSSYLHEKFSGWPSASIHPQDKAERVKFINYFLPKSKVVFYTLTPAAIVVHDNVAVVHYFYYMVSKDADGVENTDQSGWTDILVKEGDKWVLIADCGGSKS
jgi:hypothetical protein